MAVQSTTTRGDIVAAFRTERSLAEDSEVATSQQIIQCINALDASSCNAETVGSALAEETPPRHLGDEQLALLSWVDTAWDYWESHYTLDPVIQRKVRQLKPLALALAVTEPGFTQMGSHAIHLLLDQVYLGGLGWTTQSGSSGQLFEHRLSHVIEQARNWFESPGQDLLSIVEVFAASVERSIHRVQFDAQVIYQSRQGILGDRARRLIVANLLNSLLTGGPNTLNVSNFVRGEWFESGVMTLERCGLDSPEWQEFSTVSEIMIETLRPSNSTAAPTDGQETTSTARLIPLIRRALVSLASDPDALEDSIALIEYEDLRQSSGTSSPPAPPELIDTSELTLEGDAEAPIPELEKGGWYQVSHATGPRRLKLIEIDSFDREYLFCEYGGAKIESLDFELVESLHSSGDISRLDELASFTRSLQDVLAAASASRPPTVEPAAEPAAEQAEQDDAAAPPSPDPGDADKPRLQQDFSASIPLDENGTAEDATETEVNPAINAGEPPPPLVEASPIEASPPAPDTEAQSDRKLAKIVPLQATFEPVNADDITRQLVGAWFGFHDTERPLLARLVVFDRENSSFLFVNRAGIKVRELSESSFRSLVQQGLVDMLSPTTDLRAQILELRKPG